MLLDPGRDWGRCGFIVSGGGAQQRGEVSESTILVPPAQTESPGCPTTPGAFQGPRLRLPSLNAPLQNFRQA